MRLLIAALIVSMLVPGPVMAQTAPAADVWRTFAERVPVGTELQVRLVDGTKFRATLVQVDAAAMLLQPKTRVPVPLQPVAYDAVAELALVKGGLGAGKSIAIGVAAGAGAFWAMVAIAFAIFAD